ncbi:hypothetical protein AMS68_002029 [Peltaster fructicola]|uniref:Grh/CP2 DB domain-containing protein n=1 Tax=Peltaster fructicola TaxID=286661 RepID=A0A6H0XP24_9PEZI|nr:hypothetical protein AMS68_002029 [Peltaster fructicola]
MSSQSIDLAPFDDAPPQNEWFSQHATTSTPSAAWTSHDVKFDTQIQNTQTVKDYIAELEAQYSTDANAIDSCPPAASCVSSEFESLPMFDRTSLRVPSIAMWHDLEITQRAPSWQQYGTKSPMREQHAQPLSCEDDFVLRRLGGPSKSERQGSDKTSYGLTSTQYDDLQPIASPASNVLSKACAALQGSCLHSDDSDCYPRHDSFSTPWDTDSRWRVLLLAPTTLAESREETPVTYLNKGRLYDLHILDTAHQRHAPSAYRTCVRLAFEDDAVGEEQGSPASWWRMWEEIRGTAEAGKEQRLAQAIEYVPWSSLLADHRGVPQQSSMPHLESVSLDGFNLLWSASESALCSITVRFHFLSTDFTRLKGIKGRMIRLCIETQAIGGDPAAAEIRYCRIKLFRDHGAERKLAIDIAHVKKSIHKIHERLRQLMSNVQTPHRRSSQIAPPPSDLQIEFARSP